MIVLKAKVDPHRLFRGAQYIWEAMLKLTRENGTFTTYDVDMLCGGHPHYRTTVRDFTRRWVKSGHLSEDARQETKRFKVIKSCRQFPSVRRDGTEVPRGQQFMWNAMRQLDWFTIDGLRFAATTEDHKPERGTVKSYVKELNRAGYFMVRPSDPHNKPWHYRLKPSMNTGPDAPMIMRGKVIFDPNTQSIVGEPELQEAN